MLLMILLGFGLIILGYCIYIYNRLISLDNFSKEGWSGIDVQLKLRADLIPNLIECVKGYMSHERTVLEKLTELRSQCLTTTNLAERAANETQLSGTLRQLFALAENYPDLKASQNFIDLQKSLTQVEDQIQLARRYYNGTVRDFNILVTSFPSNQVATRFRFITKPFFEIEDSQERTAPTIKFP